MYNNTVPHEYFFFFNLIVNTTFLFMFNIFFYFQPVKVMLCEDIETYKKNVSWNAFFKSDLFAYE
jgi:hypothetical protein